jgi:hypothetical protein
MHWYDWLLLIFAGMVWYPYHWRKNSGLDV